MIHKTFNFTFNELGITAIQVQYDMGYREELPDPSIIEIITDVLTECESLIGIKGEYRVFNNPRFDQQLQTVELNDIIFEVNKTVFSLLKKSESIAVFLSTAGEETALRGKQAMLEGDLLKGFAYDVIGSHIVDSAAELLHNDLDSIMVSSGLKTSNRFNPGYCGWNVTEQHKLFRLMPENFSRIRLTESALMDPVKSGSGFIGIGKNIKRVPFTCSFCEMTDCFYRREKI